MPITSKKNKHYENKRWADLKIKLIDLDFNLDFNLDLVKLF